MMQLQYDSPSTKKAGDKLVITKEYAEKQLENSLLQEAANSR